MPTVQFYHLLTTPLERALPKLLEKAYAGGFKTLLVTASEEQSEQLDQLLWTYDPGSFLPHGTDKNPEPERQPILIVSGPSSFGLTEGPPAMEGDPSVKPKDDEKRLLLVTSGTIPPEPNAFERILDMFDGSDQAAVQAARTRWTAYKTAGCEVSYLRQTVTGGWEKAN